MEVLSKKDSRKLLSAIEDGFKAFKKTVKKRNIDLNAFIDDDKYQPVLMEILLSYDITDENKRLKFLRYCLEHGANPNIKCKEGYNCLQVAVEQERLSRALDLFLDFGGDVNLSSNNASSPREKVILNFPWRTEGKERAFQLSLVEKVLMLGGGQFEDSFSVYLDRFPEDVLALLEKYKSVKPQKITEKVVQPAFPTNLKYPDIAKKIWKELVPPSGYADSVQGELLRSVEKLRDEAQRNGNGNYYKYHKTLAKFILEVLVNSGLFDKEENAKIQKNVKKLMKAKYPYTEDDVYDFLTDKICVFYLNNETLIKFENEVQD
ncbi:MAG TPA: ankyrin repeat domain-containing protein [Leucothrix sp.]|nr:ankyrin repeat domain-containing protein [Leucothrix sp.]